MRSYRPRHVAAVTVLLALPAFTCGVGPVLRNLIRRVEAIEQALLAIEVPPYVVDANGEQVGKVVGVEAGDTLVDWWMYASTSTAVQLTVDDFPPFVVTATRYELQVRDLPIVYFESDDCTGTPWIALRPFYSTYDSPSLWPKISLPVLDTSVPGGRTVYLADPEATPQPLTPLSKLVPEAGAYRRCQESDPVYGFDDAIPMLPVADLDGLYTPPFRIVTTP